MKHPNKTVDLVLLTLSIAGFIAALSLAGGCATLERIQWPDIIINQPTTPDAPTEPTTPTPEDPPPPVASDDQAVWDSIKWLTSRGPSAKGAKQVMVLRAALQGTSKVSFDWDGAYPWPGGGNDLMHFFEWDGTRYVGGKADWIRDGGQKLKLLDKLPSGYNGHKVPAPGAKVAVAWTRADGRERSNLFELRWPGTPSAPSPADPVAPPPVAESGFLWEPSGDTVRVRVPMAHWQMFVFSRRKHHTLYGPDKSGKGEYVLPMSGAAFAAASKAAGDDGSIMVFANTTAVETPPHKNAGWRVMDPSRRQAGDGGRLKPGEDK